MPNKQKYSARSIIPCQLTDTDKSEYVSHTKAEMLYRLSVEVANKFDAFSVDVEFREYTKRLSGMPHLDEKRVDMVARVTATTPPANNVFEKEALCLQETRS